MGDVMIDIETLSVLPTAIIATIAAVKFNRYSLDENNDIAFYRRVNLSSCEELGMTKCKDTVDWWERKSEQTKDEIFGDENRIDIKTCLEELVQWFEHNFPDTSKVRVWSQGITFDIVILENAFRQTGIKVPWKFWNCRDTRTVFDITQTKHIPSAEAHNSEADCKAQILTLRRALQKL